jgi:hypothetical protein
MIKKRGVIVKINKLVGCIKMYIINNNHEDGGLVEKIACCNWFFI